MEVTTNDNRLCARCNSLDLDAVLSAQPKGIPRKFIMNLGSENERRTNSQCSFCCLLNAVKPSSNDSSNWEDLALYSFRPKDRLWSFEDKNAVLGVLRLKDTKRKGSQDRITESLSRTGYIASTTPPIFSSNSITLRGRAIDHERVDYSTIRDWLLYCQSKHKNCCPGKESVEGGSLNLINCCSRRLERVSLPCSYIALSYVWGAVIHTESFLQLQNDNILLSLPKTVEDAIAVTKSLGYKYLWVDKYCINQRDSKERTDQIRQMDLIYSNSELTIVAAAGANSDAGLPGISSFQRTRQPRAVVRHHLLVSLMRDPKQVILDSPWMSRGWTFQEAVLSQRLLIFTEQQVYFECQSTNLCETVDLMRDWTGWSIFRPDDKRRGFSWSILQYLAQYSKRKLTYGDDIINAILGVFRWFEKGKNPVYHHWGVPILPPIIKGRNGWPSPVQRSLSDGFIVGLCWQQVAPGHRRAGFPSWSWAGWNICLSEYSEEYERGLRMQGVSNIEVFFEDADKLPTPMEVLWNSSGPTTSVSPYIHLSACTIQIRLQYDLTSTYTQPKFLPSGIKPNLGSAWWASWDVDEDISIQARLYLLQNTEETSEYFMDLTRKIFIGVVLGETHFVSLEQNTFVMVAQDNGECFERIGHLILGQGHIRIVNKVLDKSMELVPDKETFEAFFWHQEKQLLRIG